MVQRVIGDPERHPDIVGDALGDHGVADVASIDNRTVSIMNMYEPQTGAIIGRPILDEHDRLARTT